MVVSKKQPIKKGKKAPTETSAKMQVSHGVLPLSLGVIIPALWAKGKKKFKNSVAFSVLHKENFSLAFFWAIK